VFGRSQQPPPSWDEQRTASVEGKAIYGGVPLHEAERIWQRTSQEQHQAAILCDFQTATKANTEAKACLLHAEQVAAQASVALVEARRAMRRVTDGVV